MEINIREALSIKDNFEKYRAVKSILIQGERKSRRPKYTIVIPTYKRVGTLVETLESALSQDYQEEFDVVICDNNPERNDETENYISCIKDNRVLYYKNEENIGMTGNWNRCVELSDGQNIVMIHDDDILYPFFLTKCDQILNENEFVKILYPAKNSWDQSNSGKYPKPNNIRKAKLFKLNILDFFFQGIAPTGVLFNREEMLRLGGFYENAYPASDLYFSVKAIENSKIYAYTMPLSVYRWGVNESFKTSTLVGFIKVYNPLRIYIGKKIGLPSFLVRYANRQYCNQNYSFIKEKLPNEIPNLDMRIFDIPKGKIEFLIYRAFCFVITHLAGLYHRTSSQVI